MRSGLWPTSNRDTTWRAPRLAPTPSCTPRRCSFAEYNAESPAGAGYAQRLCELFDGLPLMARFREHWDARFPTPITPLLDALMESYRDWGGTARPPQIAIVDWREVPTWSEFELLRDAFEALDVPTLIADPRDLTFDGEHLTADGTRIDLVYRRVLINDIVAKPDECRALVEAYRARAVCVANTLRCKIPHKKAFFAILTDAAFARFFSDAERTLIHRHVPWTRVVTRRADDRVPSAASGNSCVLKPSDEYGGTGVTLGWETSRLDWDRDDRTRARAGQPRLGRAGADRGAARAVPGLRIRRHRGARDAGGLRAVSLPRARWWIPDAPQRDGPGQRHVGRRAGAELRRQ